MSVKAFHPQDSRVSADALARFINAEISGDLHEVPGVGDKTIELLSRASTAITASGTTVTIPGITCTFGLIGVFLMFKNHGPGGAPVGDIEHMQRFYCWLCAIGTPAGYRAGLAHSIGEKVSISFPGLYNAGAYESR